MKLIFSKEDDKFPAWQMLALYVIIVLITALLIYLVSSRFFYSLSAGIIFAWVIMVIIYYLWAIHFYNVNMGWTQEDWDKLDDKKSNQNLSGLIDDEPIVNPHGNETLGLPPGTVRGTLAISLLVAALAMMVASFEMNSTLDANRIYVDNFEFIKTAFLMMVAFYFGNKSLQAIGSRNQGVYLPGNQNENTNNQTTTTPSKIPRVSSNQMNAARQALQTGRADQQLNLDDELKDSEAKS